MHFQQRAVVSICLKSLHVCNHYELFGTAIIFDSLISGCGKELN